MKIKIQLLTIFVFIYNIYGINLKGTVGIDGGYIPSQTFFIGKDEFGNKYFKKYYDIIQLGMFYNIDLPFNLIFQTSGELYSINILNQKNHFDSNSTLQGFTLIMKQYLNRIAGDISILYRIINFDCIKYYFGPSIGYARISQSQYFIYNEDNTTIDKEYVSVFWGTGPFLKIGSIFRLSYYGINIGIRLGMEYLYSETKISNFKEKKNETPVGFFPNGIYGCNENRIIWKCGIDYLL